MKTQSILFLMLYLAMQSFAQQGINYKALIKDDNSNVVANQSITVLFNIYEGASLSNLVYRETHTPTTDDNGIIIINIGEGTIIAGTFTTINWGSDDYYLNTQLDIESGLVDMGTTAFKTVPYALHAANVTGLEALDEGNGIGWRLKGRDLIRFGNIGYEALDLSYSSFDSSTKGATGTYSIAFGYDATASGFTSTAFGYNGTASGNYSTAFGNTSVAFGDYSTAIGDNTIASGENSLAMGESTIASGARSTAMGFDTTASGLNSTAIGNRTIASGGSSTAFGIETTASGSVSTAMGHNTVASSFLGTAIGQYNTGYGNNPTDWLETDPLFEIGNGTSSFNKSNAFTVLKNAKVGIGTATPFTPLHIEGGTDANLTDPFDGYLIIGSLFGANLVFDNNEIMARNVLESSTLFLQHNGGAVSVGGSIVHSSDRRLKRDIQPISYGLQTVLKLRPKSYLWKNRPEQRQRSLGLIAQEVQPIIQELVLNNEKDDMLSVNYTELISILIKAIQDQQEIIDNLEFEVSNQKGIISSQDKKMQSQNNNYKNLLKRLEKLEMADNK